MEENYKIISDQLGNDKHCKAYIIKGNLSNKKLIVKIYEDSRLAFYENKIGILKELNQINFEPETDKFFVMFKDINYNPNMFIIPKEIMEINLQFLFYDYLPKLSLLDYFVHFGWRMKEIHVKLLCYKLLKVIEKLQEINICHNNINVSNILFDDNFNPKLIHYSEVKRITEENKSQINNDIFGLVKTLARILSYGFFGSINYNKNKKQYEIFFNKIIKKGKKTHLEESKFWEYIKNEYDVNISENF